MASEVEIKLAAQKKEDERRRGGVPLVLARGGKGVADLARGGAGLAGLGGSGAGGIAGLIGVGGKVALIMFMTAMGIGAWGVGQYFAGRAGGAIAPKTHVGADKTAAAAPAYDVDPNTLPRDYRKGDGMMVVAESLDGKTAEQRAAEAAAAEAAARAAAEKKPEEAQAPDAKSAVAGVVDPNAAVVAAAGAGEGQKAGAFGKKFGALSTLGAGGAGKAGPSLNGGAGNFGGVGRTFGQGLGTARGFGSTRAPGRTSARVPRGKPGSRAFHQLQNANLLSRAGASAATGETASAAAQQAFNSAPQAQSVITGAGAAPTGSGGASGDAGTNVNPNHSGPTMGTENTGTDPGTTSAPVARGQDVSPWKMAALAGGVALLIAGALLMIAALVAKTKTPQSLAIAKMLAMAALAFGVIATMCGLAIMGMGQMMYGGIMTGGGALVSVLAYMAMTGYDKAEAQLKAATNTGTTNTGQTVAGPKGASAPPAAPPAAQPPMPPATAPPAVNGSAALNPGTVNIQVPAGYPEVPPEIPLDPPTA